MPWLQENGIRYPIEKIKDGLIENSVTLGFCYQWLNGLNSFTIHTSGSTGIPKTMDVTRTQLVTSAGITARFLGLKPEQVALVCVNTEFIAGIMMLVRALEVGMNMIITKPEANPLHLISSNTSIDFVALVPYQIEAILNSPQRNNLNKIKNVIIGGAPVSNQIKEELKKFTNTIYATYGMTETLTHIAMQKLSGNNPDEFLNVLPGFEISLDERDCLVIKAAHLGPEPVITNDLVQLKDRNRFQWLGRIDRVINSGGIKIIPEKVESVVANTFIKYNLTNRFFVAGLPHPQLGESTILLVEGELPPVMMNNISRELGMVLSRYENPKAIHKLSKFVYTENGKINRPETINILRFKISNS